MKKDIVLLSVHLQCNMCETNYKNEISANRKKATNLWIQRRDRLCSSLNNGHPKILDTYP